MALHLDRERRASATPKIPRAKLVQLATAKFIPEHTDVLLGVPPENWSN